MKELELVSKRDRQAKKDTLVKDEDGYVRILLGKFNTFNSSGIYYKVPDVNKILGPGSLVHRRIENGLLRAECNHPDVSNMSTQEMTRRIIFLDPNNVAAAIKRIEVINTGVPEKGFNLPILEIYGWVKPAGPKKDCLEDFLYDPAINVAFSVRSLVKQYKLGGIVMRDVVLVSTWDFVHEPGIKDATKWKGAGLEHSLDVVIESEEDVIAALEESTEVICEDGKCVLKTMKDIVKEKNRDVILRW